MLLREIFEKRYFEDEKDSDLESHYKDFLKKSNELKICNAWDQFDKLVKEFFHSSKTRLFVFLSHSHSCLSYTMGLISFLRNHYNVFVYIDSEDKNLPSITSLITAQTIKKYIKKSDRFLFLATNGAIKSKWCNWELGIGDVLKFPKDQLAFIAWHDVNIACGDYKGHEYIELYPFIVYYGHDKLYSDGEINTTAHRTRRVRRHINKEYVEKSDDLAFMEECPFQLKDYFSDSDELPKKEGWYVRFKDEGKCIYVPLHDWLSPNFFRVRRKKRQLDF